MQLAQTSDEITSVSKLLLCTLVPATKERVLAKMPGPSPVLTVRVKRHKLAA